MARGASDDNPLMFMRSMGAAERAVHYRQEAEKFRQMAQTELDGQIRESLLSLAKQYDYLADDLMPPKALQA
jgi:hypothetical protein